MSFLTASALLRVMECVRKEAPDLPTQQLHVLVAVALSEGSSQVEIQMRCGLTKTSSGRNIRALTKRTVDGGEGLNWIRAEQNPHNNREKLLYLTETGRKTLEVLLEPLEALTHGHLSARQ